MKNYVEYEFKVSRTVKVYQNGRETDDNYEKAKEEAIKQVIHDIDSDWLEYENSKEFEEEEVA